ncbi:MAG: TonB-dependent receptor [Gallionella sp.]|nr:TonB-dependent receptor [Gallionella sp.]
MKKQLLDSGKLFALSCIYVSVMHAAVAAENKDVETLGDVVVSATKTEQSSSDAPASVSVVSAKNIDSMNIHSPDQALKFSPGAYTTRTAGNEPSVMGTNVVLRGIPDYSRTLVLVDGQTLNDPYIGAVTWESVPAETIKRIEVVPGPFSSLYGGSAMAGVINIITKVPTKREFSLKGGYGTENFKSGSFVYQDHPLEWMGVSFDYGYKQSDGFVKDEVLIASSGAGGALPAATGARQTTDASGNLRYLIGDKGPIGWNSENIGVKFYLDLPANSKLSVGASQFKYSSFGRNHYNFYLRNLAGNPVVPGNYAVNGTKIAATEKNLLTGPDSDIKTQNRYTLEFEKQLAQATLKATLGHTDIPLYNNYIVLGAADTLAGGGAATRMLRPSKETSGSLQLSLPVAENNFLVAGVSAGKRDIYTVTYNITDWRNKDAVGPIANQTGGTDTSYALYVQDEIKLLDKLTAYLGGRYDSVTAQGYIEGAGGVATRTTYAATTQTHLSPKVSMVYRPQEQTTLRASVGNAFHAPQLRDTFGWWTPMTGYTYTPNPLLKPETVTSWEIGVEQQVGSSTLLRATYYENSLKDLIYRTQDDILLKQSVANAGAAKVKGIELEARQKLTSELTAFVNVTYNDSKFTKNPAKVLTEGKRMTNTPDKMANLGIQGAMGPWSGSLMGKYVGKVYTNDVNLDTVSGVFGSYDAYFITDAKLSYKVKNSIALSLSVSNLGDRRYYQSTLAQGRAYFGEAEFKF